MTGERGLWKLKMEEDISKRLGLRGSKGLVRRLCLGMLTGQTCTRGSSLERHLKARCSGTDLHSALWKQEAPGGGTVPNRTREPQLQWETISKSQDRELLQKAASMNL